MTLKNHNPLFVPLADCHIHANAMATDEDVERLANKYSVDLSRHAHIKPGGKRFWNPEDHSSFHDAYDATVALMRTPEDLKDVAKHALIRASAEGCIYAEILASGLNNYRVGDPMPVFENNMLALASAIREAGEETGIVAFISLTAKRHLKSGAAGAQQLLDAYEFMKNRHPESAYYITGFNMAGNEEHANTDIFTDVFDRAHNRLGLGCACHAGEVRSADDIWTALELPGISRIGHALSAAHDPAVMRALKERHILVEQLLTLNETIFPKIYRRPEDHPIRRFHDEGLDIGLGSDDPGMVGNSIGGEYFKATEKYGFSPAALLSFTANSVRYAFAPTAIKTKLLAKLQKFAADNGILMQPENFRVP
ncbi:MAG: hypothetical protein KGI97_04335, partial [Alphaproteobacteria bacterium]|nr:hypothetical protein [Alphaproteobacteria bacterium]